MNGFLQMIVLADESRDGINAKFGTWKDALEIRIQGLYDK